MARVAGSKKGDSPKVKTIADLINEGIVENPDNGRWFVRGPNVDSLLEVASRDEAVYTLGHIHGNDRGSQFALMTDLHSFDFNVTPGDSPAKQARGAWRFRDGLVKLLERLDS